MLIFKTQAKLRRIIYKTLFVSNYFFYFNYNFTVLLLFLNYKLYKLTLGDTFQQSASEP